MKRPISRLDFRSVLAVVLVPIALAAMDANPADSRQMVEGFVDATEYRNRFKQ